MNTFSKATCKNLELTIAENNLIKIRPQLLRLSNCCNQLFQTNPDLISDVYKRTIYSRDTHVGVCVCVYVCVCVCVCVCVLLLLLQYKCLGRVALQP